MMDYTNTAWVIFLTPHKKLLTKISSLQKYGKIMVDGLKVIYGKTNLGDWVFRILENPMAKTFSFHDGEVILKKQNGYHRLRKFSLDSVLMLGMFFCIGISASIIIREIRSPVPTLETVTADEPAATIKVESQVPVIAPETQTKPAVKYNPQSHEEFLLAKGLFQNGHIKEAMKMWKKNKMNQEDRKEASSLMAQAHYSQCENFSEQHEERKAVISCEKALMLSGHERAAFFLGKQEEKAKRIYLEGYTIQKFDPHIAKQKYAQVLQSARTKSTWRSKAQYQLRKLKNSR